MSNPAHHPPRRAQPAKDRRIALVTGASRSVGKGVALALGRAGWTVYLTGRTETPLRGAAEEVTAGGGHGIAVVCDHRDDAQIAALIERIAAEQHGRLDLLVNNVWAAPAGFARHHRPFWERPLDDWDTLIAVGLRAHYVAAVAAAPLMVARGTGLIVNISSFGTRGYLHSVLYGVSKAGLDKMAADMAVDLAGTGVAAVSLWPGLVKNETMTALMERGLTDFHGFPLANAETPEFIGRVVAALADDPRLADRSGHTWITAEIARDYAITDVAGNQPDSHRALFGGGPLY